MTIQNLFQHNGHLPNFTVMVPGACNAKCNFCFWNHEDGKIKPPDNYLELLKETIDNLPEQTFRAVSLTGGEPTLSKYLKPIVNVLKTRNWDRIVLTTNGQRADLAIDAGITIINLSRHHYLDEENNKIFKAKMIDTATVSRLAGMVDLNINCIINDKTDYKFILKMCEYAKSVGLNKICFRREASNVDATPIEKDFIELYGVVSDNKCPVCRSVVQGALGMKIVWKASHPEPSQFLGKVYEGVFHPDGKLYADWSRKMPIEIKLGADYWRNKYLQEKKKNEEIRLYKEVSKRNKVRSNCGPSSGSCGSGGCGGGCGG
jgi:MoaA/NifB/PqqE/SkfB family radical SAM enzyme